MMMLQLGYVILFGFAALGVIMVTSISFLVKIRVDAFKLCFVYQRIIPNLTFMEDDIGE